MSFDFEKPDQEGEINDRLKRRFVDRLGEKIKRIRKDLAERNWHILKTECRQLKSGKSFGFAELTRLAGKAEELIPDETSASSRSVSNPVARQAVESLIIEIDNILIQNSPNT